ELPGDSIRELRPKLVAAGIVVSSPSVADLELEATPALRRRILADERMRRVRRSGKAKQQADAQRVGRETHGVVDPLRFPGIYFRMVLDPAHASDGRMYQKLELVRTLGELVRELRRELKRFVLFDLVLGHELREEAAIDSPRDVVPRRNGEERAR